jgi:hypothetical protein
MRIQSTPRKRRISALPPRKPRPRRKGGTHPRGNRTRGRDWRSTMSARTAIPCGSRILRTRLSYFYCSTSRWALRCTVRRSRSLEKRLASWRSCMNSSLKSISTLTQDKRMTNSSYVSNELTHFLGRSLSDDRGRYAPLREVVRTGWLKASNRHQLGPGFVGQSDGQKALSSNEAIKVRVRLLL